MKMSTIYFQTHTSIKFLKIQNVFKKVILTIKKHILEMVFVVIKHQSLFTADLCFVLQVYSTCVPTECTSAEEWLAHVKVNRK